MFVRKVFLAALAVFIPLSAGAGCNELLHAFGNQLVDATCFASTDLTTNNPATTPANNSIAGLPPGAFTPNTDRNVISRILPIAHPSPRPYPESS